MFEYLSLLLLEGYQIKLAYILKKIGLMKKLIVNNNNNNYYFHNCLLHQFS